MKSSTAQFGLYAILPQIVLAGQQPKWEHQRHIFQRQAIGNFSVGDVGNGNDNGNTINSGNTQLSSNIVDSFNTNTINYYSTGPDCYYAKLCDTCNIVKVSKANGTYVDQPCPVCPVESFHCPGYSLQKTTPHAVNGTSGVCNYQPPVCITCKAITPPPPPSLTTVQVHCPTCPAQTEVITCPATATSTIASIATASGASVAKVVASSILSQATAVTVTAPATATSVAASTVVNVECTTCPAGKAATTVAQVPVSPLPGSPSSPGSAAAAPAGNLSTPAAPAAPAFTGSAATLVMSVLSIGLGLTVSTLLFL